MTELFTPTKRTAAIPETVRAGRPKLPNPTESLIAELAAAGIPSEKARVLNVPDAANAAKVVRYLQAAGKAHSTPFTVRTQVQEEGDRALITYWAIPLVVRKPREEASA